MKMFDTKYSVRGERRQRRMIAGGVALFVAFALMGFTQRLNVLPHWVPLVGMDSGVALCKGIAERGKVVNEAPVAQTDLDEIRRVRAMFADSRYEDIRINGVAMMDLSAQFVTMRKDAAEPDLGTALALVGPMMTANAGLAGGCREHGYEIPAMGDRP